jgi:hypothetical protein
MAARLGLWVNKAKSFLHPLRRKILQKVFGLVLDNGCWMRCKISERYKFYDEHYVNFIKLCRLRQAGHVMRMDESDPAGKVLYTKPGGTADRKRGRPKLEWCQMLEDITWFGCRNWRLNAQSTEEWWKLTEEVKSHSRIIGIRIHSFI